MNNTYKTFAVTDPTNVSFDQFTEPETRHEFSAKYQERRRALIQEAQRAPVRQRETSVSRTASRFTYRVAATVAAVCIALPAAAWAVTSHADFFAGALGDGWRESQAAEQSYQYHDGEKPPTPVVYPASEVVQLDAEAAEALLGDAVCDEPVSISSPDGHELTITSAVRSENALVYRFTLHRDGGVTCLQWDEHTNNVAAKGAHMAPGSQFSWTSAGDEFVYIDPTASTADTLVGYAYSVFGEPVPQGRPATLTVYTWDVPFEDSAEDQFHVQSYEIPCTKAVPSATFESAEGSAVTVSPLGLVLSERALFPEPEAPDGYDMACDPINVRSIVLKMDDGSAYTVFDLAENLDNTLSACGFDASLSVAFNRLVDPGHVASIEVGVTDVQDVDDLHDLSETDWPVRTVVYNLA